MLDSVLSTQELIIKNLHAGGLITTYACGSRCAHCLYASGPAWPGEYMTADTVRAVLSAVRRLRCASIHIGGGEPFLNPEGLGRVLETVSGEGFRIEHVETGAAWVKDPDSAGRLLSRLKACGLETLLISISPFHNEHIPFYKTKSLFQACEQVGISVFPWVLDFYGDLESLDDRRTHSLSEYQEKFGADYLKKIPARYWIHLGGRALKTFAGVLPEKPLEEILGGGGDRCLELLDTEHFHFDLFGNYIPGLCSGLAVRQEDVGELLNEQDYPLLSMLFRHGIKGFFETAKTRHGFKANKTYLSKCHLCAHIRKFLVCERKLESRELQPRLFYDQLELP